MKKMIQMMMCLFLLSMGTPAVAQEITKEVKKEAKRLKKEGWNVVPGALPMETQLAKSFKMQAETDSHVQPKYVFGEAQSIGEFYDAAKMTASAVAKSDLANKISSQITSLVEAQLKNEQLPNDQAVSVSQVCEEFKSICEQKLGTIIPVMELQRTKKNGNKEVLMRAAYDIGKGLSTGKSFVDSKCKEKGIPFVVAMEQ